MTHYFALFSIVFMIAFVGVFDLRHHRQKLRRLWNSITLLTPEELARIRLIRSACEEA